VLVASVDAKSHRHQGRRPAAHPKHNPKDSLLYELRKFMGSTPHLLQQRPSSEGPEGKRASASRTVPRPTRELALGRNVLRRLHAVER